MRLMKRSTLMTALLVCIGSYSHAKTIGTYRAQVSVQNQSDIGVFIGMLNGWSCSESTAVSYRETVADHKGNDKELVRDQAGTWTWSPLAGQPNTNIRFDRDFYASNPVLNVSVNSTCHKTTQKYDSCATQSYDSKGNSHCESGYVSETETAYFGWKCHFANLPDQPGQIVSQECAPYSTGWAMSFDALILQNLNSKRLSSIIVLDGLTEETLANTCSGNPNSKPYLINLSQGVGGHMGEDDFEFDVVVDGISHKVTTETGLLSADILYCPKANQQNAQIQITAVERDLIWDDLYKTISTPIPLQNNAVTKIGFTRKSYSASIFTPKVSEVKVTVREARR